MKKGKGMLALLLVLALLLAGCGDAGTSEPQETSSASAALPAETEARDTLVYGMGEAPEGLDPQNDLDDAATAIESRIYDTLIARNPETNELEPSLALSWEWLDDTHLFVALRDDVLFHDGSPMTADDVLYTLERLCENEATAGLYGMIDLERTAVEADYYITIALDEPSAMFERLLSDTRASILSRAYATRGEEEEEAELDGAVDLLFAQSPMGTGPYALSDWEEGRSITLTRQEDYWGETPAFETVSFRFIDTAADRVTAAAAGELDLAVFQPSELVGLDTGGLTLHQAAADRVGLLVFNPEDDDLSFEVRQAIAYAVDWQAAADRLGVELPGSILPEGASGYMSQTGYTKDTAAASELLAEAGYADGLTLTATVSERDPLGAQLFAAITDELAAVGITLEVETVDADSYRAMDDEGAVQLSYFELPVRSGDPGAILFETADPTPRTAGWIADEDYNDAYDACLATTEPSERMEAAAELQQRVYDAVLAIPCTQLRPVYYLAEELAIA